MTKTTTEYCVRVRDTFRREGFGDDDYREHGAEWGTWADDLRLLTIHGTDADHDAVCDLLDRDDSVVTIVRLPVVTERTDAWWDAIEAQVRE